MVRGLRSVVCGTWFVRSFVSFVCSFVRVFVCCLFLPVKNDSKHCLTPTHDRVGQKTPDLSDREKQIILRTVENVAHDLLKKVGTPERTNDGYYGNVPPSCRMKGHFQRKHNEP